MQKPMYLNQNNFLACYAISLALSTALASVCNIIAFIAI